MSPPELYRKSVSPSALVLAAGLECLLRNYAGNQYLRLPWCWPQDLNVSSGTMPGISFSVCLGVGRRTRMSPPELCRESVSPSAFVLVAGLECLLQESVS